MDGISALSESEARMTLKVVMTTDERFQQVTAAEWWDTTGIDLVPQVEVDRYLDCNPGVGLMVVEAADEDA